jgi:esterase/lipase superfamily enzyme
MLLRRFPVWIAVAAAMGIAACAHRPVSAGSDASRVKLTEPRTTPTETATAPLPVAESRETPTETAVPESPPEATPTPGPVRERRIREVLFDRGRADIRPDQRAVIEQNAEILKSTTEPFSIEGHADGSGSSAYNLALGERRANAVRDALVGLGVPPNRLRTVSYGEERPACTESEESCLQRNRSVILRSLATAAIGDRDDAPFTIVRVYFGTDRVQTGTRNAGPAFGPDPDENTTFGTCTVSIPKDHRIGHWERPSLWTLRFTEDQRKDVMLLSVQSRTEEDFIALLRSAVQRDAARQAFVFVHGYNTTFDSAIQQTAILAYDLKFQGAPIAYSWPSRAEFAKYPADEDAVQLTVDHLRDFLRMVATRSGATVVHLIAHSMGNRALTQALAALQNDTTGPRPTNLGEVVLTAPDMEVGLFKRAVDAAKALVRRVTLYASSKDKALLASHTFHSNARAGDAGNQILIMPGVDSIDVSSVTTDFVGHAYFRENTSVITDIFELLHANPPDRRMCLTASHSPAGSFWIFGRCSR